MAGYPAVFYYPDLVPAQLFPETGYRNQIIVASVSSVIMALYKILLLID